MALSLLGMCVILSYEFAAILDLEDDIPLLIQYFPHYIRTAIPVGVFYFVIFLLQPQHRLSKFERLGFFAIGIEVLVELLYLPADLLLQDENAIEVANEYIVAMGETIGIATCFILLPVALQKVNRYQKFLYDNYSTTSGKSVKWLRSFLLLALGIATVWFISFMLYLWGHYVAYEYAFAFVALGIVMLLFCVGYFIILQYDWFQIVPFAEEVTNKEPVGNKLSAKTNIYHASLKQLMQDEKAYEDIDLTLDNLSERLQISSGYLSQIINEKEQKNFFEFVNSYRVEAVKTKLLDNDYRNYTIMGIALESGFKSKSTFNSVFKKLTGQTPSTFKRLHMRS